ncbi:MAG: alpha/beta fold hydrolase [Bacteroidia bacterium]|nr:alpha/beta fold hydrolase [Bacteroidia bacterium]
MKLFYRKYGEGPPLVILHGLYGSSDNWVSIAKKLVNNFTVYLPDQRNHGQSPHSDVHDYDSMSNDLHEFVIELNLKKFFLAGHSMGGKTAVRFALRWPEMLEGLLVADISPFETKARYTEYYNQHLTILKTLAKIDISEARSRAEVEKLFAEKISSVRIRKLILKNIHRSDEGKLSWKINNASLLKNIDKIMDSVVAKNEILEPVTGFPVIFLKGEKSDYIPPEDFSLILRLFPAVEFRVIKDAGHWIHVDNPEAVITEINNLLNN